jgi:hypothetical protein
VTDASGVPIAGVIVGEPRGFFEGLGATEREFEFAGDSRSAPTGEDGRFEVTGEKRELVAYKSGLAPRAVGARAGAGDSGSAPLDVTLLRAGHIEIVGIPSEIRREPWSRSIETLESEEERHGYPPESFRASGPPGDSIGWYHVPAGRYVVRFWRSTGGRDEPPPPAPRAAFEWRVEVAPDATASIDLEKEW